MAPLWPSADKSAHSKAASELATSHCRLPISDLECSALAPLWPKRRQVGALQGGVRIANGSLLISNCQLPIFLISSGVDVFSDKLAIGNWKLAMIYVGTSGYSYKEWKGSFYPEKIPAKDMLSYYASRLRAVELNNTFYRLPQRSMVESWKAQVPDDFRFSVKASQRITHFKRLKDVAEETRFMLETISALENRLGVVLFQLPPNMKKDLDRLETFLKDLPVATRAAFEFRHPTWFDDDVLELLRSQNRALCVSDTDDMPVNRIDKTADWGYLRLRRVNYSDSDLAEWIERVRAQDWDTTFVFFKHEDEGTGPKLAAQFVSLTKAADLHG